jgi:prepilin-type N-terminal cleavage/methylation domain-containing protein/prepilin-type processing-associated H-X9-DG protein
MLSEPKKSFTLVELLVVMTIISILAALLMPVLSKARRYASSISCLNKLRQTGFLLSQYADDNRGWTMSSYMRNKQWARWLNDLGYSQGQTIYSLDTEKADGPESIYICPDIFPYGRFGYISTSYGMRQPCSYIYYYHIFGGKIRYFCEGTSAGGSIGTSASGFALIGDAASPSTMQARYFYIYDEPSLSKYRLYAVHDGKTNLAFADNHVAALKGGNIFEQAKAYIDSAGVVQTQ